MKEAFYNFWTKHLKTPLFPFAGTAIEPYKNNVARVPHICVKVPTAGGKTFFAYNAINTIFDAFSYDKPRAVVWLVPSITILDQTIKNLKDTNHPYRQKINAPFGNKVEVSDKAALLQGSGFKATSNKITLMLALIMLCSNLSAQQVGHTTVTFVDSLRSNRQILTEIYYPATSPGDNTPISAGVYSLITFGHGFVMGWSAYQNFWDLLVPEGYIMVFPRTESGFSPSHADFGKDLTFLITKIQSSGAGTFVPSSSVGTTSAIMGHSMGGGSSFLAAENNSAITTMVSFAAANTNPSSITAAQQCSVPTLLFSGVNDCVTPSSQHGDIMYDSTAAAYKTQVNITGAGHCYFANSNFNCTLGESTCSPSPTITRAAQQSVTNDFLKLWLAYFLKNDCQKAQQFQDSLSVSSRISYRQSQPIGCVTRITDTHFSPDAFSAFPNPFSNFLTMELPNENIRNVDLYNVLMQNAGEYLFADEDSKVTLDFSSLTNGIYFIKINNKYWKKVLKCAFE